MFLIYAILWVGLSSVNGGVFDAIGEHEGIVVLRQDLAHSSNDMIRVRLDIPVTEWITYDAMLNELSLDPLMTGVETTVTARAKELAQARDLLDVNLWVRNLRLSRQPLLLLLPNEAVSDAFTAGYDRNTKTYGLNSSCNNILEAMGDRSLKVKWLSILGELKTKATTTAPAPKSGRRKRDVAEEADALEVELGDMIQQLQLASTTMSETLTKLSTGKVPEECIQDSQWTAFAAAVAPGLTTTDQQNYVKEIRTYLAKFPLTIHRVMSSTTAPITTTIRVLLLVPARGSVRTMILRTLRYIPVKRDGKRMILTNQPEMVMSDLQQKWITGKDPKEVIKERCLPSWASETQYWCYGGLDLQSSQPQQCALDALPADNRHPDSSCYIPMAIKETRVVPLPSGNLLVSPEGPQDVTVQCAKKYHKEIIKDDTRITLPRGCTGIIGNHVFTANPLSTILEPPASWESKTSLLPIPRDNELVPHESFNGEEPIITFPDEDWAVQPVAPSTTVEPDMPVWVTESRDWVERAVSRQDVQIGLGVTTALLVLYCCCAPASWPRLNGPAWCLRGTGRGIVAAWTWLSGRVQAIRAQRRPTRRTRRVRGPRSGEVLRDPLERAMMLQILPAEFIP